MRMGMIVSFQLYLTCRLWVLCLASDAEGEQKELGESCCRLALEISLRVATVATVMVEIEENEKIVIAKPVASRPRFTNPKSLLCVASNASPSAAITGTSVAVIRPTTVRFKPAEVQSSAACHPSKQDQESNVASNVIYKPVAKLVSRTTVSLLSNMGGNGIAAPMQEVIEVGQRAQSSNRVACQTDATLEVHHDIPRQSEQRAIAADETKSSFPANGRDRPSYDGHNWRKYGQKQVKGSEYPRSYYKCTYPNCPVKKKVEKTLDGQIAEIVYKGEHNHLKPLPPHLTPPDGRAQTPAYEAAGREVQSHSMNQQAEIAGAHEGRSENQDVTESSNQPTSSGNQPVINHVTSAACSAGPSTSNNSLGLSGECEGVIEAEGGDVRGKRAKSYNHSLGARTIEEANSDPQIVVQNNTDSGMIGDGFRWRKYGQKVVKGKKYPRSYYRCTNPDCSVRKYVERTLEDPGTFITTYEGKHNHAMPTNTKN